MAVNPTFSRCAQAGRCQRRRTAAHLVLGPTSAPSGRDPQAGPPPVLPGAASGRKSGSPGHRNGSCYSAHLVPVSAPASVPCPCPLPLLLFPAPCPCSCPLPPVLVPAPCPCSLVPAPVLAPPLLLPRVIKNVCAGGGLQMLSGPGPEVFLEAPETCPTGKDQEPGTVPAWRQCVGSTASSCRGFRLAPWC